MCLKTPRWMANIFNFLDPVVQSVVSLTSSLGVISLTVLADSIYNILIFFAEKMWVSFALQKLLTFFFSKKFQHICVSLYVNFNESLTNAVISFEQLGQDKELFMMKIKLTLVLLSPDMLCLCKQCRSRSVGFYRSQLIWICTVCHSVFEFVSTTWIK